MITKDRLKELIKEGATIWTVGRYSFQDKIEEIKLDKYFFSVSNSALIYPDLFYTKFEDLFETKKQAEWALKYHTTRIEELDLPTWEEFKTYSVCDYIEFIGKDCIAYELSNDYDLTAESKFILLQQNGKDWMEWDFNEENYIKACDLCLKLFKGEEK